MIRCARLCRRQLLRPHVVAVFLVAHQLTAVPLGDLLDEELLAALRAGLEYRPVPEHEIAVRIIRAAEEDFPPPGLPLDNVPAVLRADEAGGLLLHVFAGGIAAARGELAEAP